MVESNSTLILIVVLIALLVKEIVLGHIREVQAMKERRDLLTRIQAHDLGEYVTTSAALDDTNISLADRVRLAADRREKRRRENMGEEEESYTPTVYDPEVVNAQSDFHAGIAILDDASSGG